MQTRAIYTELNEIELDLVTGGAPDAGASPDAGAKPDASKPTPPKTTTTTKLEISLDATLKDSAKEGLTKEGKAGVKWSIEKKTEK